MGEQFQKLQKLIDVISADNNIHICICDVAYILKGDMLKIERKNKMHTLDFCDTAKSTEAGFKLCMKCKTETNIKAVTEKKLFCRHCAYGLYEIIKPVVADDVVVCIIYLGNLVTDKEKSVKYLTDVAHKTKVDIKEMNKHLDKAEFIQDTGKYIDIINLLDSYIRLLLSVSNGKKNENEQKYNWKVSEITEYIKENFNRNIQLKQLAKLYFVNGKYLGRIFKKETGYYFHEYLNKIRIENASAQLLRTQKSVLEVALDNGFGNVTYFNRKFKECYGVTPTEYRTKT